MQQLRVTIWNEFVHEREKPQVARIYPRGIHQTLADALGRQTDWSVRSATLEEPEHGLPPTVLDNTDVLVWWGHAAHEAVREDVATRVQERVVAGMGLVVLHSGHESKVFKRLMGRSCHLCWREAGEGRMPNPAAQRKSTGLPKTSMAKKTIISPGPSSSSVGIIFLKIV